MTTQALLELVLRHQLTFDYSERAFAHVCLKLDLLHDAASTGRITTLTDLPDHALRGYLNEIIFLARETLAEMARTRDTQPGTNTTRRH